MALSTHSKFYFGHVVDEQNKFINFKEGAGDELFAVLPIGAYTLSRFTEVVENALNKAGLLTYNVTVDRASRVLTISASGVFSILGATGSSASFSTLPLMGFDLTDLTGAATYTGAGASGQEYSTQFILQSYLASKDNKKLASAVVTKSASGNNVSVQAFGEERFTKFNLTYISNYPVGDGFRFRTNQTGVEEANNFLQYCIAKNPIEFMADETRVDIFEKLLLESTPKDPSGIAYELTEYYDKALPGFYESGILVFKLITE